jgi:predicted acyltransferase (DUF342 family)
LRDIPGIGVAAGDLGGWVSSGRNLSQDGDSWVNDDARVTDDARVSGNAWVDGNARVFEHARVSGDAWVSDDAWVAGNAKVSGYAKVAGSAMVCGNARVSGRAWVLGTVSGNERVAGRVPGRAGQRWIDSLNLTDCDEVTPKRLVPSLADATTLLMLAANEEDTDTARDMVARASALIVLARRGVARSSRRACVPVVGSDPHAIWMAAASVVTVAATPGVDVGYCLRHAEALLRTEWKRR